MKEVTEFYRFIDERHRIWHRRFVEKKEQPWTEDPILRLYNFTNVYRELDRGTQYLWERVDKGSSFANMLYQIILYRFINRIETFDEIGFIPTIDDNWDSFFPILEQMRKDKKPIFNTAYRVICNAGKGVKRIDELRNVMEPLTEESNMEGECFIIGCGNSTSLEMFNEMLQYLKHIGPFIAYEISIDFLNIDPLNDWSEDDWANPGPGCRVGLSYIDERFKTAGNVALVEFMRALRAKQHENLPDDFPYYKGKELSLRNIEHSLCEFGKYMNIKNKVGRSRPLFSPYQS